MSNSDPFKQRRHEIRILRFAILCGLITLSGRTIHGQVPPKLDTDAFIAGCTAGTFDSYPALKSNCPVPRAQTTTAISQPLAYTPQQLEEMNRYAQQGAAALQQYLQKPVTPLSLPTAGDIPSFAPNTKPESDSTEYHPMPIYHETGNSGGALAGIARAAAAYQQRSASFSSYDSSLKLAEAQKELATVKAELAAHIAWAKFLEQQRATQEAASRELAEAMAAGAPLLKDGLTLDEATNLQKHLGLDPQQRHIFPDVLTIAVDSKGQMHFDMIGLPIDEFRYTLVGDLITPQEQEIIRAKSWQGFESAANEVIDPPSPPGFKPVKLLYYAPEFRYAPERYVQDKIQPPPPPGFEPVSNLPPGIVEDKIIQSAPLPPPITLPPGFEMNPDLGETMDWLESSSHTTGENRPVHIGSAFYFTSIDSAPFAPFRKIVLRTSVVSNGTVDYVEEAFNVRDIDPASVSLRKSPNGDFYIFTARTKNGVLTIYDRTHEQAVSSIAFELPLGYGARFAKAFKRAVILAGIAEPSM